MKLRLNPDITASEYLQISKEINKLQDLYAETKIETDITVNIVAFKDVGEEALVKGNYVYKGKEE